MKIYRAMTCVTNAYPFCVVMQIGSLAGSPARQQHQRGAKAMNDTPRELSADELESVSGSGLNMGDLASVIMHPSYEALWVVEAIAWSLA